MRFFAPSLQLGSSAAVQTMEAAAASFQPEPITTPSRVLEIERLPYATSVNAPIASVSHDEVVEAGRHLVVEARVRLERMSTIVTGV